MATHGLLGGEVAGYLHLAGFGVANDVLATAVAISWCESKWVVDAKGGPNSNGSYDWGLMQINDQHHPTAAEKTQPLPNCRRAFALYSGRGRKFTDWSTYNDGSYRNEMDRGRQAVQRLQEAGPAYENGLAHGATDSRSAGSNMTPPVIPSNPLTGALDGLSRTLTHIASNAAALILALLLLALGVILIMHKDVTATVKAVSPVGRLVGGGK